LLPCSSSASVGVQVEEGDFEFQIDEKDEKDITKCG